MDTLATLAKSHGLSLKDYLDEIAETLADMRKTPETDPDSHQR
jgi:primosomal protein N''